MRILLAALLLGATPTAVANPIALEQYLIGTWNCTSAAGSGMQNYTATYSYSMGRHWLRAVNTAKNSTSVDFMSYANRTWTVIDVEPTGDYSVLEAPDTGLSHQAYVTKYPKPGLHVTFDRQSMTHYTLTFSGTMGGKPAVWKDTCMKRS
jgi:hypothetical protein